MKTLYNLILTAMMVFTIEVSVAQTKNNSIYLELLGNAVVYSVNYDRIITISPKVKLAPRVGFEFIPRKLDNYSPYGEWSFPLELNMLYGKNSDSNNHFEGGLGLSLYSLVETFKQDNNGNALNPELKMGKVTTLRIGFRHQKPRGGVTYRVGIMARLSQDKFSESRVGDDLFYRLWPGFSVGYSF